MQKGLGEWYNTAPVQLLKEYGFVLLFNETCEDVANYNFILSAERSVIREQESIMACVGICLHLTFTDGSNYMLSSNHCKRRVVLRKRKAMLPQK